MPVGLDPLEGLADRRGHVAEDVVQDEVGIAQHRVHRRAQLVAHVGEELRLVLARELELLALLLDLLEQPRVLDGDRRLRGEGMQQVDGVGRNRRPAHAVVRAENAHGAPAGDHGADEKRLEPQGGNRRVGRAQSILLRQRVRLAEKQRLAVAVDGRQRARLAEGYRHADQISPVALAEPGPRADHEPVGRRAERPDVEVVEADHLARGVEDARELLREGQRLLERRREAGELLLVARELLEGPALLVDLPEEPRILDGDDRLGREGLEQVHDRLRERPRHLPPDHQPTDHAAPRAGAGRRGARGTPPRAGRAARSAARCSRSGIWNGGARRRRLPDRALADAGCATGGGPRSAPRPCRSSPGARTPASASSNS